MAEEAIRVQEQRLVGGEFVPVYRQTEAGLVKFEDGETFQQKYDSGELKGADGAAGAPGKDGAAGTNGKDGAPGAVGPAGPNVVSESTSTSFNGLLKGTGTAVAQAVAGADYVTPEGLTSAIQSAIQNTWEASY